jgi:predicted metal-dependent hydrolase
MFESLLFKGIEYPVKSDVKARFDGNIFYVEPTRTEIIALYKKLARRELTRRTIQIARIMNVVPVSVKITSAEARWGSCSSKRSLNFSWRLIMADEAAIDYVIIHELAHLTELNHSDRFWAIVKTYCPDYKACKERLKTLAERLHKENL